ncbi:BON domain-containing protein [Gulbenkiania mobilis]
MNVDTKDGVVTLKGNTDTAQKTRAEEIAKTVEGVKSVENQLTAK